MSNSLQTSQLFSPSPVTWGLRGDPSLWDELRDRLGEETWPPSVEALAERLSSLFLELTGEPLSRGSHFKIERFDHGGLSSGYISPEYWRSKGFPLLLERYQRLSEEPL